MGDFADLVSPYLAGHSAASPTSRARRALRPSGATVVRESDARPRARPRPGRGPRPDLAEAGPLTPDDWERVRLHAYHTERVLAGRRSSPRWRRRRPHHERLDGSGYHRGAAAAALTPGRRGCSPPPTPTTR